MRLISHRDLLRTFERLFRRAEICVRPSEGFHPKPRMNFASPLALGIAGLDEVLEVDLAAPQLLETLLETLNRHSVPGLRFHSAESLDHTRKAQARSLRYAAALPESEVERVALAAAALWAAPSCLAIRESDGRSIDIRPLIEELSVKGQSLQMTLLVSDQIGVRARDVLEQLGLSDLEMSGELFRTGVELRA